MEIQELVSRARLLFAGAPKRLEVFKLVNGRRSAKEISRKAGKPYVPTLNDLQKMKDMELITPRKDRNGKVLKKENSIVYEKAPLIIHIPISMFIDPTKIVKERVESKKLTKAAKDRAPPSIHIPSEKEILDICRSGEDQTYEFKAPGTETRNLTKEVAAFANTKLGGLIFYGVEDDGTIVGTDKRRQELDQSLQNSMKNTISPSLVVDIKEKDVLGHKVIIVLIPAWNRKEVFHYEGRVLLRKGTNVFTATPDESRKLHSRITVI